MPKAKVFNMAGQEIGEIELSEAVFGIEPNKSVLHDSVKNHLANCRQGTQSALTKGEVSFTTKKPWRQKGTGRARFGSTRNPIWRHGGVAFGRTGEENFTKKLSKTAKKVAIRQALSLKNADKAIITIETFACPKGKTKETIEMLKANKIENANVLLVVSEKDELVLRATNNVANLKAVRPTYLNVFDIMNADKIVITEKSLPMIQDWLMGEEK